MRDGLAPPSERSGWFLGTLLLGWASVALAQTVGRDYWPSDLADVDVPVASGGQIGVLFDAWITGGSTIYVIGKVEGATNIVARAYDPATHALGTAYTLLTPAGSGAEEFIESANINVCAKVSVTGDTLTAVGPRYVFDHIGINPGSIVVTGSGGGEDCPSVAVTAGSFRDGYFDGTTEKLDSVQLSDIGTCDTFTAAYDYTNCSLDTTERYRCPMATDQDGDTGTTEYGYCKLFMMYEGVYDGDSDTNTEDDRVLLLAHAQELLPTSGTSSIWRRYITGATPATTDVRLRNDGPHDTDTGTADEYSFVSVPSLIRDHDDAVWRMWFVSEDYQASSNTTSGVRYSESDDDGLSWGFGTYTAPANCWDSAGAAYDTDVCQALLWSVAPPNYPTTPKNPDIVDPEVFLLNADTDAALELGMMFTGADNGCSPDPLPAVQLFAYHEAMGDQSGSTGWTWVSNVHADGTNGVVVTDSNTTCVGNGARILDPEIVRYAAGQYVMFAHSPGGVHVYGSGFECADFDDNDSDSATDWWPADTGAPIGDAQCTSPMDDSE